MSRAGQRGQATALRREVGLLRWPLARPGHVYRGPADFVLAHGEQFVPRLLPPGSWRGAAKTCFGNAIVAAVMYGLDYVEGYAFAPGCGGLPIHHAWNADGLSVADTTWSAPGLAYLGVRFSVERADDSTWNGDASVLDDWQRQWPLLRARWMGEPEHVWDASPRLDAIRLQRDGQTAAARRVWLTLEST